MWVKQLRLRSAIGGVSLQQHLLLVSPFFHCIVDPTQIIVKDMKKVKEDVDERAHGVLMWDASFMQILAEKPEAKTAVEGMDSIV